MKINFDALKNEFKNYLIEQGLAPELALQEEVSAVSIFDYDTEFIDFVEDKYNVDLETTSLDFSELLDMKFEEGKFVLPEETDIPDDTQQADDTQLTKEFDEVNFMLELLNEVISDEEFAQKIEFDNAEGISEEEIEKFLTFANELDEDKEKMSLNDIFKGVEKLENNEYKVPEDAVVEEVAQVPTLNNNNYIYNNNNNNNNNNNKDTVQNNSEDYAKMNATDLEAAQNAQMNVIAKELEDMDSTTITNKENVENAKQAYDEAIAQDENISDELKAKRQENLSEITQIDNEILSLDSQITRIDAAIYACDDNLQTLNAKEVSLNASLASLGNAPTDNKELQAEIDAKEKEINTQLEKIITDRKEVNEEKTALVDAKNELQLQLDEKKTRRDELEEQKAEIDNEIAQLGNEETKAKLEAYNDARKKLDEDLKTSKESVETAKAELTKIQGYLIKANEKEAKKLGYSEQPEIFGETGGYSWNGTGITKNMSYGYVSPNNADSKKELPVIVFLHGSGEVGGGTSALESRVYKDIFQRYGYENFNGYVLCPSLPAGKTWTSEGVASDVEAVIDDFASTHEISMDNIVIVGHSLGGTGVFEMAQSEEFSGSGKYKFKKGAALAAYPGKSYEEALNNMPIYLLDDKSHNANSIQSNIVDYMGDDDYYRQTDESHGTLDDYMLGAKDTNNPQNKHETDLDNNNRADLIEWLFDVED